MKLKITKMLPEHLEEVLAIEKSSFSTPWSHYAFAYEIKNDFAYYLVALSAGKVIGYGGMWLILDEAHITNLAVYRNYRQRGAGRAIMQEFIRHAIHSGITRLTLEVRPSNQAARHLYATLGFKEKGRRRGYYLDTNEDAIIMWKNFWEE
ncbi:MAG: ribosomal protein S18-alanine N-acetyltransferase [Peptococcaceae bacterium]